MKKYITIIAGGMIFLYLGSCKPNAGKDIEPTILTDINYLERGEEIKTAVFNVLSQNLKSSLEKGGIETAIAYCNIAAMPLVDSLSSVHKASIKRTSQRLRNPNNIADESEKTVLSRFEEQMMSGQVIKPELKESKSEVTYYAPILTNNFCLQCHGIPGETLVEANKDLITKFYPQDSAIGYSEGELRGIWSIKFDK